MQAEEEKPAAASPADSLRELDRQTPVLDPLDATSRLFLASLFQKYRASLFRYLTGLVPTSEDAAELVQESYMRLLKHSNLSQLEAVARSYLFKTATNLARDHYRRRVTHRAQDHFNIDDEPVIDDSHDPARELEWNQTLDLVKQGIKQLRPLTRRVFLLRRFRDKTYLEIAGILGISTRTVERRMTEAMELLATRLGERR